MTIEMIQKTHMTQNLIRVIITDPGDEQEGSSIVKEIVLNYD
jgi:hypothetical protein